MGCRGLDACSSLGGEVLVFDGSTYGYKRGYDLAPASQVSEVAGTIQQQTRNLFGGMRAHHNRVLVKALDTAPDLRRRRGKVVEGASLLRAVRSADGRLPGTNGAVGC